MLLLVILLFLLQGHNLYGDTPVTSTSLRGGKSAVAEKLKFSFSYYSLSVTPEGELALPVKFDFREFVINEVNRYSTLVSESIYKLDNLKRISEEKKFVVPLRFIDTNLKAARDLEKLFYENIKEIKTALKGSSNTEDVKIIKEKLKNIRLLSERIEVLWRSSEDFYKKTTNFIPFRVELIK